MCAACMQRETCAAHHCSQPLLRLAAPLSRCCNDTAYQRVADALLGEGRMEWMWPEESDEEDKGQQWQQQQQRLQQR